LDLIPVFSYIFLGGKCRYCQNRIRPRYLILELCSGAIFLLLALFKDMHFTSSIHDWTFFFLDILFLVCLFITAGIDKELFKLSNGVIIYGFVIGVLSIIAKLVFEEAVLINICVFAVALILSLIISKLSNSIVEKKPEDKASGARGRIKYIVQILELLGVIGLFFNLKAFLIGFAVLIGVVLITALYKKLANREFKVPYGFLTAVVYAIVMIVL
jgi:leader peptidase (prepilin peptidase)/N-methyltransferase